MPAARRWRRRPVAAAAIMLLSGGRLLRSAAGALIPPLIQRGSAARCGIKIPIVPRSSRCCWGRMVVGTMTTTRGSSRITNIAADCGSDWSHGRAATTTASRSSLMPASTVPAVAAVRGTTYHRTTTSSSSALSDGDKTTAGNDNESNKSYKLSNDDCKMRFENKTILEALQLAMQDLEENHVSEPLPSAVQLLAKALNLPWESGFRDIQQIWDDNAAAALSTTTSTTTTTNGTASAKQQGQRLLTAVEAQQFASLLERRCQHEPIQYVLGQWDFLDYTIQVRAPLLCPRPETEDLVLHVLNDISINLNKQEHPTTTKTTTSILRVLDVGCGTGCIGIALADKIPHAVIAAIDIDPVAVQTSQDNARRILGPSSADSGSSNSRFQAILAPAESFVMLGQEEKQQLFDVVVSNPPYIPQADMENLDPTVAEYESHNALFGGGADGMDIIRTIVTRLPLWCRSGAVCWMEVDPMHPAILRDWLPYEHKNNDSVRVEFVSSHNDMYGRERFVKLAVR